MEYDADRVSELIVGKENAISALCKIEHISSRFEAYNTLFGGVVSSKQSRPISYWNGYEIFLNYCNDIDGKHIVSELPFGEDDVKKAVSKVQVKNPWLSHPTLIKRIHRIKESSASVSICTGKIASAISLVPEEIYKKVSDNFYLNSGLDAITTINDQQFAEMLATEISEHSFPLNLRSFFERDISEFNLSEMKPDLESPSPINATNTQLVEEFNQALSDYHLLVAFQRGEIKEKNLRYNDVVYSRKNVPIEQQLRVVENLAEKIRSVDEKICRLALSKCSSQELILKAYDDIFYSQFIIEKIKENLFPNRNVLHNELSKVARRDNEEFRQLQRYLLDYKNAIKGAISEIEMTRLFPVVHVDMWKSIQDFMNDYVTFSGEYIPSEEISYVFDIPDQPINLYESLAYYSKKIITDTIIGKAPLMAWNNSVALSDTHA